MLCLYCININKCYVSRPGQFVNRVPRVQNMPIGSPDNTIPDHKNLLDTKDYDY